MSQQEMVNVEETLLSNQKEEETITEKSSRAGRICFIITMVLLSLWVLSGITTLSLYFGAREECGWISPPSNPCHKMAHSNLTVCIMSKRSLDIGNMTKCQVIDKTMGIFGWIFVVPIIALIAIGLASSPFAACAM